MKRKRVWRYYCEFCGKSSCAAGHMSKHEQRCTANPNRVCGFCSLHPDFPVSDVSLQSLVDLCPNPDDFLVSTDDYGCRYYTPQLRPLIEAALQDLRSKTECPACILAALRQSGLTATGLTNDLFDWKIESKAALAGTRPERDEYF